MVQLLTFKFFQLAWVSRRELLVSQNSKAKPKQRRLKWRVESRHANIMTKFAINTKVMRTSYVFQLANPTQSSGKSWVTRYSFSFPSHFIFSQSRTTFIQWSALETLLHLWNRTKKSCCSAGWSFWSFLYWFLVPKTLTMYKIKRIYTVYILLIIHNNAKIKKVSWVFLNWASPAAHYLMGCWLYLFLSTQIVRCLTKSNRKYVRKNIFVGFQFLLRPSTHVFGTLEANIDKEFEGFPGWNFISWKLKKLPGKYRIQLCDHLALTFCLPNFKFITFYKL